MNELNENINTESRSDVLYHRFVSVWLQINEYRVLKAEVENALEIRRALHMIILLLAGIIASLPKFTNPELHTVNNGLDITVWGLVISAVLLELTRKVEELQFKHAFSMDAEALYLANFQE